MIISAPSIVDIMTIISGICLWFSTIIGFVWWLNTKFNLLMPSKDFYKSHEDLQDRVRQLEINTAKLLQRVMNGEKYLDEFEQQQRRTTP